MALTEIFAADAAGIARAAQLLRDGAVVAIPTDTVYGLAASAERQEALERIYDIKGRPRERPLILMAPSVAAFEDWAIIDDRARVLMKRWWPGPLTLVLHATQRARFPLAMGQPPTIGVRIPASDAMQSLLAEISSGIGTTSANRSGAPPATNAREAILEGVAAVLDGGDAPLGRPSTILDLSVEPPRVLREGAVPAEVLGA